MSNGKIKFFNYEKGFGFIIPSDGGKELFVHKNDTNAQLSEGDSVSYDLQQTEKGPSAVNVQKV